MFNPFRRPAYSPGSAALLDGEEIRPCGMCLLCVAACPTGALQYRNRKWSIDLGLCIMCQDCAAVCPNGLITDR